MTDFLIAGGGVVGLSLAYELSHRGAKVRLLDRGPLGREASWAGAGILTPAERAGAQLPIDQLRALSVERTATWSRQLQAETGIDNGYRPCGAFEVAIEAADLEPWQRSLDAWKAQGVPTEDVPPARCQQLEPALAADLAGIYRLPTEAQIRNPWHLRALEAACRQRGVHLAEHCPVLGFERQGTRLLGLNTNQGLIQGETIVLATGAWAPSQLEELGLQLDARPMRGQIALLKAPAPLLTHVVWAGARYLVPREDGRILVGSTMEDAGFASHPTAAGILGLLQLAFRLAPALGALEFETAWAGLRPGSVDGLPYMGRVPGFDNFFVSCGHYRAGFELAAGSAVVLAQLLLGEEPEVPLEAFRPER